MIQFKILTKEKNLAVLNFSILVVRNCEDSVLNAENIIPVIMETQSHEWLILCCANWQCKLLFNNKWFA